MVIAHEFAYVRPATLSDAVAALVSGGRSARVLAGGTDLVPWLRDDVIHPSIVVDIKDIAGLREIERFDGHIRLGALVTFSDLLRSEVVEDAVPVLREMAHQVASVGIRNRATVVGNICSAVPSLDAGPLLLAFGATVHIVGTAGERTLPIEAWFVGPRATRIDQGEIVTAVTLNVPAGDHGAAFLKLSRYRGEDLAQASLAAMVTPDRNYRIAFGAVGPVPHRAHSIEAFLDGKTLDEDVLRTARDLVAGEIAPITDVRASRAYRAHMCAVMLDRGLQAAVTRCAGTGPAYQSLLI